MESLEQLLGSKSHLIIGQKFEIMLDIISVFWVIWLDIVLNTSFFGAFRASFRIKITIDYRTKRSKWCLILKAHFLGWWQFFFFFTIYHQTHNRLIVFFGIFFLVFSPRKRIFCSKSLKKLKVQKWCQNGSNSII